MASRISYLVRFTSCHGRPTWLAKLRRTVNRGLLKYIEQLTSVIGHADRAAPMRDYCVGLVAAEGRKSVEPMAKRWFRSGQKWRTECEGRISIVKRRHGLDRYKAYIGMNRWVGLGAIADNVINISRAMEKQATQPGHRRVEIGGTWYRKSV
jgi:hypothetical protein